MSPKAASCAEEFDLDLRIQGGEEAWMRADRLAAADVPVVLKALSNLPTEFDRLGTRFDNAAKLHEAGVPVVLSTFDTHNARNLRLEAGHAVRYGLDRDAALRAVTLAPAQMLGIDDSHAPWRPEKRPTLSRGRAIRSSPSRASNTSSSMARRCPMIRARSASCGGTRTLAGVPPPTTMARSNSRWLVPAPCPSKLGTTIDRRVLTGRPESLGPGNRPFRKQTRVGVEGKPGRRLRTV
jgi:hypothetical protein